VENGKLNCNQTLFTFEIKVANVLYIVRFGLYFRTRHLYEIPVETKILFAVIKFLFEFVYFFGIIIFLMIIIFL